LPLDCFHRRQSGLVEIADLAQHCGMHVQRRAGVGAGNDLLAAARGNELRELLLGDLDSLGGANPPRDRCGITPRLAQVVEHIRRKLLREAWMLQQFRKAGRTRVRLTHLDGGHDVRTAQNVGHRAGAGRTLATHQQANILVGVIGERIGREHVMQPVDAGLDSRAISKRCGARRHRRRHCGRAPSR
jgi:hypothetical protein